MRWRSHHHAGPGRSLDSRDHVEPFRIHGHGNRATSGLKQRWVGRDEWDTFASKARCRPHLGGVANVEEAEFDRGFSGMALRLFDLQQRRWSIYWVDSRGGVLLPPVHGGFTGDEGVFYGEDTDGGRLVQVQFRWTRQGADRARWEQVFSLDGETWETNWVMEFTRTHGA